MRTFEEITAEVQVAMSIADTAAIDVLAQELQSLGTPQAAAAASDALGTRSLQTGDYATALEHYRRALQMYETLGDPAGEARERDNLGGVCDYAGDFPQALEHYRRALHLYEDLGDRIGAARVTGNLAGVYTNNGDYIQALEHMQRALQVHEDMGNRGFIAIVTGNIGIVYASTGDYPQALEYYGRALELHEELGARADVARVLINMGNVHGNTGEFEHALEYYRRAQVLIEDQGNHAIEDIVTGNIIAALLELHRDEEAAQLLQKQASIEIVNPINRANRDLNFARLAEHQGDLDTAWQHLQNGLLIFNEAGARDHSAACHKRLRDLAQYRNDFASYIHHNNEYLRIAEEIRGKDVTQKMAMNEAERRIEAERRERDKERALLYGALPESVATRMLRGEDVSSDHYDNASVLFLDIVGFTTISDHIPSGHVVHLLEQIFTTLDAVCEKHDVVKIKTIGDSYMAVAFPQESSSSEQRAANAALDMLDAVSKPITEYLPDLPNGLLEDLRVTLPERLEVRIGLHVGPMTAGVIGTQRLQYDVWGDTVNVASRMESTSEPGKIQVSEAFAEALKSSPPSPLSSVSWGTDSPFPIPHSLRERGALEIKGKGLMKTYWLEGTT